MQRCEVRGCEALCSSETLLLSHSGCDSWGFSKKMEIKWDILLLLLCLSQTICFWQNSTAIYHRDPLILTNLIKEMHWQPFYLWGPSVAIKELLLTHIFNGCFCEDWLSQQSEATGFIALLHQQSRPYSPWYSAVLLLVDNCFVAGRNCSRSHLLRGYRVKGFMRKKTERNIHVSLGHNF